jgi:hypothetical protein
LGVLTDTRVYVFDDLAAEKLVVSSRGATSGNPNNFPVWPQGRPLPLLLEESSMTVMLRYFLDGLTGGNRRYFGTALALRVIRLLDRCQGCLQSEVSRSGRDVS